MELLKNELQKALMQAFKYQKTADAIEEQICNYVDNAIRIKYGEVKIKRDNLIYEFLGVRTYHSQPDDQYSIIGSFETTVTYIITEDLCEDKKMLQDLKYQYYDKRYTPHYNKKITKINLFIDENYEFNIDNIVSGKFDIQIDGIISK